MLIFIFIFLFVITPFGEEIKKDSKESTTKVDSIAKRDSIFTDSITLTTDTTSLCTLEINTVPEGALIVLDGKEIGNSPVVAKVDTGTHTIVCQKEGFYQKKVVIRIPSYEKNQLSIKLTSPAKVKIITEPPNAQLLINGEMKGFTPYKDSLFKPGKYILQLEKEGYVTKIDSFKIESGEEITIIDTLQKTVMIAPQETNKKKSIFDIAFVGGAFFLFLLIVGLIELKNR